MSTQNRTTLLLQRQSPLSASISYNYSETSGVVTQRQATNWTFVASGGQNTKQISKPNIRWNSPIKSRTTPPQQTKRQVDERMWATRKERRRYGRGVMLQCNSCSASHLLQVESSANRQTGTNPLRQAPGRVRDGQRESGTHGGGGRARQEECTRKIH